MMNYNYSDEMKADVLNAIRDDYNLADFDSRDAFEERLNEDLWVDDCVTGNASGSYTFNSYKAREYVLDNMDILKEALSEFCVDSDTLADHFINEDWEYFDVTIRCYLLGSAISDALDEFDDDEYGQQDEEIAAAT